MNHFAQMPLWAAIPVAILLVVGAGLTLLGTMGLLKFRTFYDRVHAPTLGTTGGVMGILLASMIFFTVLESRLVLHELLIGVFVLVTTPVTLMLLARAALYRDRSEGTGNVRVPDPDGIVVAAEEDTRAG